MIVFIQSELRNQISDKHTSTTHVMLFMSVIYGMNSIVWDALLHALHEVKILGWMGLLSKGAKLLNLLPQLLKEQEWQQQSLCL